MATHQSDTDATLAPTSLQLSNKRIRALDPALLHSYGESLVTVDLCRNRLKTLLGIECCKNIITLNVYFNDIDDISELARLQQCTSLVSLDMRLNPVASALDFTR
jgi:Leucine-rich repeat (LRR) protein